MIQRQLIEYSYKQQLSHIPSALSMVDYISVVFKYVKKTDYIIIGKPFGAQAYYIIWKTIGWLDDIESLSIGVKHDEIPFVDYSEETMGNALGVAAGISLIPSNRKVYVNLSDGALQMGNTLEAIQFIGKRGGNIVATVDFNNRQIAGNCSDIIPIEPVIQFFRSNGWVVFDVDGHNIEDIDYAFEHAYNLAQPAVVICKTRKGNGVPIFEQDLSWHYRKIDETNITQILQSIR